MGTDVRQRCGTGDAIAGGRCAGGSYAVRGAGGWDRIHGRWCSAAHIPVQSPAVMLQDRIGSQFTSRHLIMMLRVQVPSSSAPASRPQRLAAHGRTRQTVRSPCTFSRSPGCSHPLLTLCVLHRMLTQPPSTFVAVVACMYCSCLAFARAVGCRRALQDLSHTTLRITAATYR